MFMLRALLIPLVLLAACAPRPDNGQASRILVMGDSLLAWHSLSGNSVADALARKLQEPVTDRSVSGARVLYALPVTGAAGLNIGKQYRPGDWEWIIVNGGGNDLWLGCGCMICDRKLDRMVSADGRQGAIPDMLARLRKTGAQVVYVGYLRSPGTGSLIKHCRDEGKTLEDRIQQTAARDEGLHFLSLRTMVPHGDRSFHAADRIHPSIKASREIARRIADIIREN